MIDAKPSWIKIKSAELDNIVIELARNGESPAKIGLVLRDRHGIPKSKLISKKISGILKEKDIAFKKEAESMQETIEKIQKHIEKNKQDNTAKKSLEKKLWTLRKLKQINKI